MSVVLTVGGVGMAVAHVSFPNAKIDATTLAFLALALLPWLGSFLESFDIGGMSFKYRDLQRRVEAVEEMLVSGTTAEHAEQIKADIANFQSYLTGVELDPPPHVPHVEFWLRPKRGWFSRYYPDTNTVGLVRELADQRGYVLYQYCQAIVRKAATAWNDGSWNRPTESLRASLAAYFACSFLDSARLRSEGIPLPSGVPEIDLAGADRLKDVHRGALPPEIGFVIAQAWWELRQRIGQAGADASLSDAWRRVGAEKLPSRDTYARFVESLHTSLTQRFDSAVVDECIAGIRSRGL